jgi:hypothetical protein
MFATEDEFMGESAPMDVIDPKSDASILIYCDLDGVLADFDFGMARLKDEKGFQDQDQQVVWKEIAKDPQFFLNLPMTSDGEELWNYIKVYNPSILTGASMPTLNKLNSVANQKAAWCRKMLGMVDAVHIDVSQSAGDPRTTSLSPSGGIIFTSKSERKHECSGPGRILIDDRPGTDGKYKRSWEEAGGIFIHHKSAAETIRALQALGITPKSATMTPSITTVAGTSSSDTSNPPISKKPLAYDLKKALPATALDEVRMGGDQSNFVETLSRLPLPIAKFQLPFGHRFAPPRSLVADPQR